jgi:benzoyl-CoA reductase/2-hydroxyglutaryl-CoA dehydratase subunit BcrC/BadD/HgdB
VTDAGSRQARLRAKAREKTRAETSAELARLAARPDYKPELAYFLDLFGEDLSVSTVARRVERPVAAVMCFQAPLELFHAFGLHPLKVFNGSPAAGQIAAPHLPALTCPMLRSVLGALELEEQAACPLVIPTTCDWVVKFPEMARMARLQALGPVHWLELPRLKDSPRARERWFSEVVALGKTLVQWSGRKLNRQGILRTLETFKAARQALSRLIALRRAGLVPAAWFLLMAGAFFLDRIENWTAAVEKALPVFSKAAPASENGRIFLAGSPIYFPNFKLPHLLEKAGLTVAADDLCSSERLFPTSVAVDDPSETGLLRALAESYHQGCLCPTFGDNERRVNNILGALAGSGIRGVVFHVLKGCHPYDLESLALERPLKAAGLRFLKVETDYSTEDSRNLLTRLEAFHRTLEEGGLCS